LLGPAARVAPRSQTLARRPSRLVPAAPPVFPEVRRLLTFVSSSGFAHPHSRMHVELLGPCFKTGRLQPCLTGILLASPAVPTSCPAAKGRQPALARAFTPGQPRVPRSRGRRPPAATGVSACNLRGVNPRGPGLAILPQSRRPRCVCPGLARLPVPPHCWGVGGINPKRASRRIPN